VTGNSRGSYRTTPERTMRAFDQLPPALRDILNNARFKWADQQILTSFRTRVKGGEHPALVTADLVEHIAFLDAVTAEQDDARDLRGLVRRARRA
jgi:hypothetical protein